MSDELKAAIELLTSSYGDLRLVAQGIHVDQEEVHEALAEAEPDTPEFVALTILAK